tara:strand:- start:1900 stop:2340 length:441 start_codon:yes stop_codon:yes gene_type:complete
VKHIRQQDFFEDDHSDLVFEDGKICIKCDTKLPLSSFSPASGGNFLRPECKKCNNELSKVRLILKEQYGMPKEGYICPICKGTKDKVNGLGNKRNGSWVIDHCHESETFRGWLCHTCNRALGGFKDDTKILDRAIKYLKQHQKGLI